MQKGRLLARFFTLMKQKRERAQRGDYTHCKFRRGKKNVIVQKEKQWRAKAECIQTWYCYNLR